ncbi:hypothetical protein POMI540_3079 [Schizosaccharomyces pombe]
MSLLVKAALILKCASMLQGVSAQYFCRDTTFDKRTLESVRFESECIPTVNKRDLDPNAEGVYKRSFDGNMNPSDFQLLPLAPRDGAIVNVDKESFSKRSTTNMFDFNFSCYFGSDGHSNDTLCQQYIDVADSVGEQFSRVLNLNTPIVIDVTVVGACTGESVCSQGQGMVAGSIGGEASPSREIPMACSDGLTRYYPQAVVKQLGLSDPPSYADSDITIALNADANFYFGSGDMGYEAVDLAYVLFHEITHGLGFSTGWGVFGYENLTDPYMNALLPTVSYVIGELNGETMYAFHDVIENAFDRNIFYSIDPNEGLPTIAEFFHSVGAAFTLKADSIAGVVAQMNDTTTQFHIQANEAYRKAINPGRLVIYPDAGIDTYSPFIYLDSSYVPFSSGSSLSHVALHHYDCEPNFLMRAFYTAGATLESYIECAYGSDQADVAYGPIGPAMRTVFRRMGYSVNNLTGVTNEYSESLAKRSLSEKPKTAPTGKQLALHPLRRETSVLDSTNTTSTNATNTTTTTSSSSTASSSASASSSSSATSGAAGDLFSVSKNLMMTLTAGLCLITASLF